MNNAGASGAFSKDLSGFDPLRDKTNEMDVSTKLKLFDKPRS